MKDVTSVYMIFIVGNKYFIVSFHYMTIVYFNEYINERYILSIFCIFLLCTFSYNNTSYFNRYVYWFL